MDTCDRDECFCCGRGHYCEPTHYPSGLGETWTCPECGRLHESFDPHVDSRLPEYAVKAIPDGTFGWRSRGSAS